MGLLESIFGPRRQPAEPAAQVFRTFDAYTPVFTSRRGSLYEADLIRACVDRAALHSSKLRIDVHGSANPRLAQAMQTSPNPWQTTTQFLYRTRTILDMDTTAFLVPIVERPGSTRAVGIYTLLPSTSKMVEFRGEPWLSFQFADGTRAAIEFRRVGVLTRMQYRSDFFGSGNAPLAPTMDLLDTQRQGLSKGIKNSAAIRFIGRLQANMKPEDIRAERDRFTADNLSIANDSGLMLVDQKYADIKQVEVKPYLIDAKQHELIRTSVFNYFGMNSEVLQNSYDEDGWGAFYEGSIEPFAIQLGQVLTNMIFTEKERAFGNRVVIASSRLEYSSTMTKLRVTTALSDRGIMSNHAVADAWNLPRPPGEERWTIRGEYIDTENLDDHAVGLGLSARPKSDDEDEATESEEL